MLVLFAIFKKLVAFLIQSCGVRFCLQKTANQVIKTTFAKNTGSTVSAGSMDGYAHQSPHYAELAFRQMNETRTNNEINQLFRHELNTRATACCINESARVVSETVAKKGHVRS